jgi:coenzyme F420-0:L-glutamate ligase/coenzyme F420-1:gamma-L-glutamate ligase
LKIDNVKLKIMLILPIYTPVIRAGNDLAPILCQNFSFEENDILVLSSKVVATSEGAAIDLKSLTASDEARTIASKIGKSAVFCEAVLLETKRMNGVVTGDCTGALLTELRPSGLSQGVILVPNAGLDESNVAEGFAIGWPLYPVVSARAVRERIISIQTSKPNLAVIIGDSCVYPGRLGVTAFALASCGIDPFKSEVGHEDLFSKPLRMTVEAVADQLAVAANAVMGNAAQCIPAAVVRDHGYAMIECEGWVPGIEPSEDLFRRII